MRARRYLSLAALVLLAACTSDPEPAAEPTAEPAKASTSSPSHSGYDPAWLTQFVVDPDPGKGDRTATYPVGGQGAAPRLRPGRWRTAGGPCKFVAPDDEDNAYTLDGPLWSERPATVLLADGATFTVTNVGRIGSGECRWGWDGA